MNPVGIKFTTFFLIFSLLMLSVNLYAKERGGAKLLVIKLDGQLIEGELITVKNDSLLLLTGVDISVDINDVRIIRIKKKSKFLLGTLSGLLVGLIYPFGGATAGISGVIEGFDIVIDLKGRPEREKRRILRKLNERSLFPQKLPEVFENVAPDVKLQKLQSSSIANRSYAKPRIFRRFHIAYEFGHFFSKGADGLNEIFKSWGFADKKVTGGGAVWGGFVYQEPTRTQYYPHHYFDPNFLLKDIKLEYSVNQKFTLGFAYAFLGKFWGEGYDEMRQLDTDIGIDLFSEFQGSAYILTASYCPIADGFLKNSTFKISLGLGLSVIDLIIRAGLREFSPSKELSIKSPCLLLSAEYDHYFNQNWSIGINLGYKYSPLKIEAFSLNLTGYYLDNNDYVPFTFARYFPEEKFNVAGLGIGLNFGFHF